MRALVIQQDSSEKPELVGESLEARGFTLEPFIVQSDVNLPGGRGDFPHPGGYDLIVPMGSPWSVHDPRVASWVQPQLEFLRRATSSGVPVFGICFGAQALAAATGGVVERSPVAEIGWSNVESAIPAIDGEWFLWHQDVFTIGPAATLLATSPVGQQVFRIGRSVGVQFHPEVHSEYLGLWLESGGATEMEQSGFDPSAVLAGVRAHDGLIPDRVRSLIDWYLEEVVGS